VIFLGVDFCDLATANPELAAKSLLEAVESAERSNIVSLPAHSLEIREAKPTPTGAEIAQAAYIPPSNAADLLQREIAPLRWAIPGVIPEGLSILTGRGKLGKSWLSLEFCLAIATGRLVLGNIATEQGRALYLGLEDSERRLQDRIKKLGYGYDGLSMLSYYHAGVIPRQHLGGLGWIDKWLTDNPEARLVVIDILAKFRKPHSKNADVYQSDTDCMGEIKALADRHHVGILVVTHDRKAKDEDDVINNISGSAGIAGAADALLFLQRRRLENDNALLTVTGRDVEERRLAISRQGFNWHLDGDAEEIEMKRESREILDLLRKCGRPASASEIADELEIKRTTAKTRLYRLARGGAICADSGKFRLNDVTPKEDRGDGDE
jgi:RecA-family ATPase